MKNQYLYHFRSTFMGSSHQCGSCSSPFTIHIQSHFQQISDFVNTTMLSHKAKKAEVSALTRCVLKLTQPSQEGRTQAPVE